MLGYDNDVIWYENNVIWYDNDVIWYMMMWYDIWYDKDVIWYMIMIWYDTFVKCSWFDTRWQSHSTHLHTVHRTQNTVHRTQNTVHRTQNTVHSTQYTEHRTQYTVHRTQNDTQNGTQYINITISAHNSQNQTHAHKTHNHIYSDRK